MSVVGTEDQASLYRTRWLMAHNRLHEIVHAGGAVEVAKIWDDYLAELTTAPEIASQPA